MYRSSYNSLHEPGADGLVDLLEMKIRGSVSSQTLRRRLWKRDRLLWLDLESSHPMAAFSEELATLFPRAKFIITIRDCYSWLESIVNHHHKNNRNPLYPEFWTRLRDIYHQRGAADWTAEEHVLEQNGLYSIENYLSFWDQHYRRLLDTLPSDRSLWIRTDRLTAERDRIAAFLGVPAGTVDGGIGHANSAVRRYGLVDQIERDFIREHAERICGDLMREFFPDITW